MEEINQLNSALQNVVQDVEVEKSLNHVNPNEDKLKNLSKGDMTGMLEGDPGSSDFASNGKNGKKAWKLVKKNSLEDNKEIMTQKQKMYLFFS